MSELIEKARKAKELASDLAVKSTEEKNTALKRIAEQLVEEVDFILEENNKDLEAGRKNGLSEALLDRLKLTKERIFDMAEGLRQVIELEDPVGEVIEK